MIEFVYKNGDQPIDSSAVYTSKKMERRRISVYRPTSVAEADRAYQMHPLHTTGWNFVATARLTDHSSAGYLFIIAIAH